MYYYDLGWYTSMVVLIPAILFSFYAQFKVSSAFKKYSTVRSMKNITGAQAARKMLDANGLQHVGINICSGKLSDHYDPRNQTVNLSSEVFNNASIASIGVACHECGHAIQHAQGYSPLHIRNAIVPVTNFASSLAIPIFILGLVLQVAGLELLGILCFTFAVFFQAITLPVEFNASRRALVLMQEYGIVYEDEVKDAKKVLSAAAMTYLAALLMSLLQLVRLILISRSRR